LTDINPTLHYVHDAIHSSIGYGLERNRDQRCNIEFTFEATDFRIASSRHNFKSPWTNKNDVSRHDCRYGV